LILQRRRRLLGRARCIQRHHSRIVVVAFLVGGLIVGLIVGRWGALVAALPIGVWLALVSEVEVPGWVLGLGYGAFAAIGIAAGVLLRRSVKPSEERPSPPDDEQRSTNPS
jgi:hypothetical protein